MDPINKIERRKAFWNFLLLFTITIVIITVTIFSSIRVPFVSNANLRNEKKIAEKERDFSNEFTMDMMAIRSMLDTINDKASKPVFLDGEVRRSITTLDRKVDESKHIADKTLYISVLNTLAELTEAKKILRDEGEKDKNMGDLQTQKDELLTRRLEEAQSKIADLNQQISEYRARPARPAQRPQ